MSDYCKQCSEYLFSEDFGDFKGLAGEDLLEDGWGYTVLCEGCGLILVDDDGRRLDPDNWEDPLRVPSKQRSTPKEL